MIKDNLSKDDIHTLSKMSIMNGKAIINDNNYISLYNRDNNMIIIDLDYYKELIKLDNANPIFLRIDYKSPF